MNCNIHTGDKGLPKGLRTIALASTGEKVSVVKVQWSVEIPHSKYEQRQGWKCFLRGSEVTYPRYSAGPLLHLGVTLGIDPRASYMQDKYFATEPHSQPQADSFSKSLKRVILFLPCMYKYYCSHDFITLIIWTFLLVKELINCLLSKLISKIITIVYVNGMEYDNLTRMWDAEMR